MDVWQYWGNSKRKYINLLNDHETYSTWEKNEENRVAGKWKDASCQKGSKTGFPLSQDWCVCVCIYIHVYIERESHQMPDGLLMLTRSSEDCSSLFQLTLTSSALQRLLQQKWDLPGRKKFWLNPSLNSDICPSSMCQWLFKEAGTGSVKQLLY